MATDAELAFVATMRDEASSVAKSARKAIDSVGGTTRPIETALLIDANKAKASIGEIDRELEGVSDLARREGEESGDELGRGLADGISGAKGKIVGAIGALGIGAALVEGLDIEAGSDKLAASLGANARQAAQYGKVAGDLYAGAWGESLDDVNAAVASVATSIDGLGRGKALTDAAAQALDFATIFEVDVARAAQVAGQAVRTGLAKDATEAFDLLTRAAQQVPVNVREDVMDAADEYGPFFKALGYDGAQAFGVLADGAGKGMYGIDKAGDAVKEFTIRATDMSAASQDAYKAIGLDAQNMAADLLAGGDRAKGATDKIIAGILGIENPVKRANTAIALFGTPLEDLGVNEIPKFLRSLTGAETGLRDVEGASKDAGATLNDNARTNLTSFMRQAKMTFVDVVGGQVVPIVSDLASFLATNFGPAVEAVGDVVGDVVGFFREHETVTKVLAGALAALIVVTTAHAAVLAVAAAGSLSLWLKGTRLVSAATKVWAAVQWAMNAALAANPIVLVVLAIVALVAVIVLAWKKSETFRDIVLGVWEAIRAGVGKAVDAVRRWISAAWSWIKGATSKTWNAIRGAVVGAWNAIRSGVSRAVAAVRAVVVGAWNAVRATVSRVVGGIVSFVLGRWNNLRENTAAAFSAVRDLVGRAWEAIRNAVRAGIDRVVDLARGLAGRVRSAVGNLGSLLWDAGASIIRGLLDGIESMIGALRDKLGAVTKLIPDWKGPMDVDRKLLTPSGQAIMGGLIRGISDEEAALRSQLAGVTGLIEGSVSPDLGSLAADARAASLTTLVRTSDVVTIRHEIVSPDGSVSDLTADQIADLIARDPKSARRLETVLRPARRRNDRNTISSSD